MPDVNNPADAGNGAPEALTLESALALIAQLMPAIQAIQALAAKSAAPEGETQTQTVDDDAPDGAANVGDPVDNAEGPDQPAKVPAADTDPDNKPAACAKDDDDADDKDKRKDGEGMDAAPRLDLKAVLASVAARDRLAARLSEHVGAFDHAAMTAEEVARYGVKKLGIQCAAGQESAVLSGYLQGRGVPRKQPATAPAVPASAGTGMDASNADNFVTRFLKGN